MFHGITSVIWKLMQNKTFLKIIFYKTKTIKI